MKPRTIAVTSVILLIALPLFAKKKVSNVFDAAPSQVYDAVYRYAQRHGTIKWADEKRFTLSGVIFVPGGNWDWQKNFDCTISVEAIEGGKKSVVNVVGSYPANQQSLVGSFGEGPAVKVLRAIREEFDNVAAEMPKDDETKRQEPNAHPQPSRQGADSLQPPSPATKVDLATVIVESTPRGCDVTVDGKYAGGTPSTMRLVPGDHTISVGKAGFRTWQRIVTLTSGGSVSITPILEAESTQVVTPIEAPTAAKDTSPKVTSNATPTAGRISDAGAGNGKASGSSTAGEDVSITPKASVTSNPVTVATNDDKKEGRSDVASIGAWSDEKPGERRDGVEISSVMPRGPADEAGLQVGDFILAIGGHYIFTVEELNKEVGRHAIGSRLDLRYRRYSTIYDTHIVVGHTADKQDPSIAK